MVEDLISRKWLAEIVSAEETSTQIEIVFTDALAAEGILAGVEARADGLVDPKVDEEARPLGRLRQRPPDDLGVQPRVHGALRHRSAGESAWPLSHSSLPCSRGGTWPHLPPFARRWA